MKNSKTRSIYTLLEWELLCKSGKAFENANGTFGSLVPIECPNVLEFQSGDLEKIRQCRAKLTDLNMVAIGDEFKMKVFCQVCHFKGVRSLGSKDNGKSDE